MAVLSRSWGLFKSAWQVLKLEKVFVFYPILAALALLAVVNSTLVGIYRGAVYLYAEKGEIAPQFDRFMITRAFAPKR